MHLQNDTRLDHLFKLETHRPEINARLAAVPDEERARLETLFKHLIHTDLGYVWVGVKPMSHECAVRSEYGLEGTPLLLEQGELLAEHSSTIFKGRLRLLVSLKDNGVEVTAADLPALLKLIRSNPQFFHQFGYDGAPPAVLSELLFAHHTDALSTVLTGVLYGYGVDNAALYARREFLTAGDETIDRGKYSVVKRIARSDVEPSPSFFSPQEELDHICGRLRGYHEGQWTDSRVFPKPELVEEEPARRDSPLPTFLGVPDSAETQAIVSRFQRGRELLRQLSLVPEVLPYLIAADLM